MISLPAVDPMLVQGVLKPTRRGNVLGGQVRSPLFGDNAYTRVYIY
jgi:hypothetical protein